jgi:predicted permease
MRFRWKQSESDLNGEVSHHLHHLTAEYIRQGHTPQEAERLAHKEFGGPEQFKERCRDERRFAWLTGFRQDITFGLRMMRRTPVVTAAAVLSLALGIGANTAIVSLMDVVMWRSLPLPDPEQLVLINWQGQGFPREIVDGASGSMNREGAGSVADFFSYSSYESLRKNAGPRAQIAAYTHGGQVSITFAGRPLVAEERGVTGNFLSVLRVLPSQGRLFSDADDAAAAAPVVVLSHRFWANTLASPADIIGRTITINNRQSTVAGVLQPAFYGLFPGDSADIYTPMHHSARASEFTNGPNLFLDDRFWGFQLIARRAPGVRNAQLEPVLDAAFRSTWSKQPTDLSKAPRLRLDEGAGGVGFLRREFRNPLLVLGSLVVLLLAIACTNIANLLLARATARRKEVATRISLGCSQGRLMRQFLTESGLLAALGGAASLAVAYLTANLLGKFLAARGSSPIDVQLDSRVFAIVGVSTAAALLVFGLFPAWQSSRLPSASLVREGSGLHGYSGRSRWSGGRILVLVQMAMSVILVMTAVLFTRNLVAIESSDPGFDRRNVVMFGLRPGTSGYEKSRLQSFYFDVEQRLAATPGVTGAGLALMRPMNIGGWWSSIRLPGSTESFNVSMNGITPGYLPLYTSRMVAGRNFTWADLNSSAKTAIISEDLAKRLGGASVLGRTIETGDGRPGSKPPAYEVVGIAPVIAVTSMKEHPYAVWVPHDRERPQTTVVVRTAAPPQAMLPSIRQAIAEIDSKLPLVEVATMEEQISKGIQRERMFATLCGGFGALALILSVVGLYGVISYGTSRRRGEIGVRLALGAMPRDVLLMIFREGVALAAAGILLGIPIVFLGAKYVEKELYQMKPLEPVTFAVTLGILMVSVIVAVGLPALRASSVAPVDTLRRE